MSTQVGTSKSGQIAHAVDEELHVFDAVFLFQLAQKRRSRISPAMLRKSCVEHDFRIDVDRRIEPHFLLFTELDLFLVDGDTIRLSRETLFVVLSVGLIPVVDGSSGSASAEPFAEITTLRQRRCGGVNSARQPNQPGWRVCPIRVQKRYVWRARDLHLEFFEHGPTATKNSLQFNLNLAVPAKLWIALIIPVVG